jgi:hypothetical protein
MVALIAIGITVAWLAPGKYHRQFVLGFLGLGVMFDLLSLFYHTMTLLTRKYMSGFPYVGLLFYGWFLLASRFALTAPHETTFGRIVAFKCLDALLLIAFHGLCQSPAFLQGPRQNYK